MWPTLPHPPHPALTVSIGWVVVKDAASGPVVAAQDDEVALVVRSAAEAAVATGGEAAVLDRAGTQVTVQHPRVHQHDGHMALSQVCLDVLHTHCAVGRRGVSWCCWAPIPYPSTGSLLVPVSLLQSLGIGSSSLCPELPALSLWPRLSLEPSRRLVGCACLSVHKDELALSGPSWGGQFSSRWVQSRATRAAHRNHHPPVPQPG